MVLNFFQFPKFLRICCLFTGRGASGMDGNFSFNADADSARASRKLILDSFGPYGLRNMTECRQVHGTEIIAEPEAAETLAEAMSCEMADAMLTSRPGLGLLIKTADCQPLLLTDGQRAMAAHVGWRGNLKNFPSKAAAFFCSYYNVPPQELWAVRGPSLGNAEFTNAAQEWGPGFMKWHDPATRRMDLWQMTRAQLEDAGVPAAHIYSMDIDTWANANSYFSWRRHKTPGRQAAIIWIRETQ